MTTTRALVEEALEVSSEADFDRLWDGLERVAPHQRPIGDRWGNRGLFTAAGGTFDHKLVELVTNMHDAIVHSEVARLNPPFGPDDVRFTELFPSPRAAVDALLGEKTRADLAKLATVELRGSEGEQSNRRDRTVVFRDRGIGMTPSEIPGALFRVGSSHKDGILWQMGAFGRGGLTVLPNCYGWVVVSRKEPNLVSDAADVVTIVAARWTKVGNRQTETAVYQVTSPWHREGDVALPFSVPASEVPDFDPGTFLAVVAFHAEGIWVSRLGDERSLDTLIDTRLFDAVLPVSLSAPVLGGRGGRQTVLRGLAQRLADNPRTDRQEGREELPFIFERNTYRLPVRYYLFATGDTGARRRFVAKDHALILNSNGQVHAHWTAPEFRQRTRLPKLADRILVVVDTDALPLPLRTQLFTADRTEILRNVAAVRLEEELISFLDDWDELSRINNDLVRDAIRRSNADRSTFALGRRIARALDLKVQRTVVSDPGVRQPRTRGPEEELLENPTSLTGPADVVAIRGRTTGVYMTLNAHDGFIPGRAAARVRCSHLDVDPDVDITVGELRGGRFRVAVAIPPDAELTAASLDVEVDAWLQSSGGFGPRLSHSLELRVVEPTEVGSRAVDAVLGTNRHDEDRRDGNAVAATVALVWTSHEHETDWDAGTVGDIDVIDADALASLDDQYAFMAGSHGDVPVVKLNEEFSPLKSYAAVRARSVGDEGVARAKDRYAVGVGVQMILIDRSLRELRGTELYPSDDVLRKIRASSARGVLAVLPDFDQVMGEAGLGDL